MNLKNILYVLKLKVTCSVIASAKQIISEGVTPNMKMFDTYCLCKIEKLDKPISSGQSASILLRVVASQHEVNQLFIGATFEFTDGPNLVAHCVLDEIIEGPTQISSESRS